jgi:aspartate kinase
MIVQSVPRIGERSDLTFTVPAASLTQAADVIEKRKQAIGYSELLTETAVTKLSIVGVGMRSNPGVAATMFQTLADRKINILAITTSEIKVSVLIPEDYTELAVRVLHTAFGLDQEDGE